MINITNKTVCCGCNACGDICPKDAIAYETDIEGFWYPKVDMNKCVDCGLCERTCPIINVGALKHNDLTQSVCYAAEHRNLEVVFDSTSGGAFSALADIMYKSGGYVGGAVFNEDFSIRQYISNDKRDLPRLRSSKYAQSRFDGFYRQVRDLLKARERVLVCGCPCQMAAMRAFLQKDYDNLIIVDFICRGINSPKVWRKHLDTFEERYGHKVVYSKAKSKEYGWRNLTQKVILDNGKAYYETKNQSRYGKGYLRTNAYCRPSCYQCHFKGYPRMSDITLADFWGIEQVEPSMDKNLGTSLIMGNSRKGEKFFEQAKPRLNYVQVPFESIEKGNPALNKPLGSPRIDRDAFFRDLDSMSFLQVAEKYINGNVSWKHRLREKCVPLARYLYEIVKYTRLLPGPMYKFFRYNTLKGIFCGKAFIPASYTRLRIRRRATFNRNGTFILGKKGRFKHSSLETRLFIDNGGTLNVDGRMVINYGADIEVFSGGTLTFKGGGGANIGLTIICGERIEIGHDVMIGRNVTIRDNNGGHYINRAGYRNTRPVIIGDKAWLCEGCTIMPGVKIGDGAIVGAHAFVMSNVPAHAMVSGNPAVVVDKDVLWKY